MKPKHRPIFDGLHYVPIFLQNHTNQDKRCPVEIMRGYIHAEEQADAIATEFINILNKYIDRNYCDGHVNYLSCQDYAIRLAADKVLSKLNETP